MQDSQSITFSPVVVTHKLETWHIVLAILLFAGLIFFAVWRSRRLTKKDSGSYT